jgi:hypothetical protein
VSDRSTFAKSGPAALLFGVGHSDPVEAVPLVWRVDGASRDIDRPCGVTFDRQISADSVEPMSASRCRNLFSHNHKGPLGTDEAIKVRPQMPWIIGSEALAREAFALAGTGSAPKRSLVWPSGEAGSNAPQSGAGKEMALSVSGDVMRSDFLD